MEKAALHFPHFACMTAAIAFLAAWVGAHVLHDRRLKRFGNPQLLGLAGMWPRRICSGVLLAGAAGALIALLGDPVTRSPLPGDGVGLVVFLVDPPGRSPGMHYLERAWGDYSRDLRQVVESVRPEQIAFYLTGSPTRIVVPSTKDVPGAFLLLEAGTAGYGASTVSAFEASVEAIRLMSSRAKVEAAPTLVVVSPKAEQEIDAVANSFQSGPPVIFVRSTSGRGRPGYRREGPDAHWMRFDPAGSLSAFAGGLGRTDERPGWPVIQVLALTAFLLLYLEWAIRLSWPAGGRVGRAMLPHPDPHDNAAVQRSSPGLSRCLLLVVICLVTRHAAASQPGHAGEASHLISLETMGPHVAVVTEISDEEPYVGQQFSVVYKLRCSIPPVAVDVDPQDFAGFWTVTAPTTGLARPEPVRLNGQAATDFLLRQLIVFPLKPGRQVLPPLRLKIKQDVNSRDDWDLTSHTRPVPVHVRPVPVTGDERDAFFMVGSLEGTVSRGESDRSPEAVLEVEGTANLDFFRPEQWLKSRDGQPILVRLKDAGRLVQTRDYEGKRRLTLLQRQRWVVSGLNGEGVVVVKPLSIPVFDPQAARWRSLEIPAFGLDPGAPQAARDLPPSAGSPQQQRSRRIRFLTPVTIAFTVSCLAFLMVVITGRRRRSA